MRIAKEFYMRTGFKQDAIVVGSSNFPVIRAGYANIIFLLLIVGSVLINQAMNDLSINIVLKGITLSIFCLATLKAYTHSISKLFIKDGKTLVIVGPFSNSEIGTAEIVKTKVYGIQSSMTIFVKIKRKTKFLSSFYFFVAASTNYGSYTDTKLKLISLLKELNGDPMER
jgi:hypothetical protein